MTSNIGNIYLIILILISASTFLISKKSLRNKYTYKSISLQFVVITFTLLKLIESYISTDYSLINVALNTHILVPIIYRISGVWGNSEGSMLLIIWLLCLINLIFMINANFVKTHKIDTLRLQSFIVFLFASFVFFVSNPFVTSMESPSEGLGFNPLLQDYTLIIHPPILYYGYIGFAIVFSTLIIGLQHKSIDKEYFSSLYPWIIAPWGFLTGGIFLGSWWAYRELGWGGFWFWDPVENISLVVWLSSTSLLHIVKLTIKKQTFYRWTILLGVTTFLLAILSLALVRSGSLVSVHSFAFDRYKGIGLLLILFILTIIPIVTCLRNFNTLPKNKLGIKLLSTESGILLNNVFIMTNCLIILIALLYPFFLKFISNNTVSIGELFYTNTLEFIFLPVVGLMTLLPFIKWNEDKFKPHLRFLILSVLGALLSILIINYLKPITKLGTNLYIFTSIASIIAITLYFLFTARDNKIPMYLGHLGFAILVLGAALCWSWQHEEYCLLSEKQYCKTIKNHQVVLEKITYRKGGNYLTRIATINLYNNNVLLGTAMPETRFYPIEKTFTHESSIINSWYGDIYFVLGEFSKNKNLSIRIKYKPFVYLIWYGSLLMVISAFVYLVIRIKNGTNNN